MVPELPAHALIVADAGFVGYALWQALLTAGHHFVIRVGANVRLLRQLGWVREHAQVVLFVAGRGGPQAPAAAGVTAGRGA